MKPMDFEEFLWAKGINENVIDYIRECYETKTPVSEATHQAMLRYFKEYICVGGLPYIVDRFISTNDMNVVWQEQHDIIEEYKDDFGKHLDENENEEIDLTLLARIIKNLYFLHWKKKAVQKNIFLQFNGCVILEL